MPLPIHNPVTKTLTSGPLVAKRRAGPEHLLKLQEADSALFHDQMAAKGIHIVFLLPNATSCTAEMDQLFDKFKATCNKSALCLVAKKMQLRMEVRVAEKDKDNESACNEDNLIEPVVLDKHRG